jgi:hypothetical protein
MFLLKYWKLLIVLILLGVTAYYSSTFTARKHELKAAKFQIELSAAREEALILREKIRQATYDHSHVAAELAAERKRKNEIITEEITVEVIKYVQTPNAGKCDLPVEFVLIHDTAATRVSASSEASSRVADPPEGFKDTDLLPIITYNYAVCSDFRLQILAWQDWARVITEK